MWHQYTTDDIYTVKKILQQQLKATEAASDNIIELDIAKKELDMLENLQRGKLIAGLAKQRFSWQPDSLLRDCGALTETLMSSSSASFAFVLPFAMASESLAQDIETDRALSSSIFAPQSDAVMEAIIQYIAENRLQILDPSDYLPELIPLFERHFESMTAAKRENMDPLELAEWVNSMDFEFTMRQAECEAAAKFFKLRVSLVSSMEKYLFEVAADLTKTISASFFVHVPIELNEWFTHQGYKSDELFNWIRNKEKSSSKSIKLYGDQYFRHHLMAWTATSATAFYDLMIWHILPGKSQLTYLVTVELPEMLIARINPYNADPYSSWNISQDLLNIENKFLGRYHDSPILHRTTNSIEINLDFPQIERYVKVVSVKMMENSEAFEDVVRQ